MWLDSKNTLCLRTKTSIQLSLLLENQNLIIRIWPLQVTVLWRPNLGPCPQTFLFQTVKSQIDPVKIITIQPKLLMLPFHVKNEFILKIDTQMLIQKNFDNHLLFWPLSIFKCRRPDRSMKSVRWAHWWRVLDTKCVDDKSEMLVTNFYVLVYNELMPGWFEQSIFRQDDKNADAWECSSLTFQTRTQIWANVFNYKKDWKMNHFNLFENNTEPNKGIY